MFKKPSAISGLRASREAAAPALRATRQWIDNDLPVALKQFFSMDLRWSYIAIGAMVVIGVVLNFLLPHGWTVWPFVMAAGILAMVNEAADRNGQGIPPFQVYALFFGALGLWVFVMAVLSITNPLILLLGISVLIYYAIRGYLQDRERRCMIETRRAENRCIHCGEPIIDPKLAFCENCGEEPNPLNTQLDRVRSTVSLAKNTAHARGVLTKEAVTAAAARKEKQLLAHSKYRKHSSARKRQ